MSSKQKKTIKGYLTAADIYRRALDLAAKWTSFDPLGAQIYDLKELVDAAFALQESVGFALTDEDWIIMGRYLPPNRRPITEESDPYMTFRNHVKGIQGAIRRLVANTALLDEMKRKVEVMRADLLELRRKGGF